MPPTYYTYLERTYPAESFAAIIRKFLARPPDPPIKGANITLKSKDVSKLIEILGNEDDPFLMAITSYLSRRLAERAKDTEIDSRTVFDVQSQRSTQHNLRLNYKDFERIEALITKHNTKGISPALRKEIEADALRKGFRLHTQVLRRTPNEF